VANQGFSMINQPALKPPSGHIWRIAPVARLAPAVINRTKTAEGRLLYRSNGPPLSFRRHQV